MKQPNNTKYSVALYMRLSRDDENYGDSVSIETQRTILRQYAKDNNLYVIDEYIDDGWSGTNFERPSFQRMMDDVDSGKVNCIITSKFPKSRKYINGSPSILMNNGKLYRKNMKKAKLDLSEFLMMCREQGFFDLSEIQTAIYEYNGKLSVLPVCTSRPVTPADMNLSPEPDLINTEVIMDGRILGENLQRLGLDTVWLDKQLKAQGYKNAKEVYLGLCDSSNKLSLYALE